MPEPKPTGLPYDAEAKRQESIKSKDMIRLFKSSKFQKMLFESANRLLNTNHEAGFAIIYDRELKKFISGQVISSEETPLSKESSAARVGYAIDNLAETSLAKAGYDIADKRQTNKIYDFLNLHLHPYGLLFPSGADLQSLIYDRADASQAGEAHQSDLTEDEINAEELKKTIAEYPIMAIGAMNGDDLLEMLLIRENFGNKRRDPLVGEHIGDRIEVGLGRGGNRNDEAFKILNESGIFKAIILKFQKARVKGADVFTPDSADLEEQIKKFCSNEK